MPDPIPGPTPGRRPLRAATGGVLLAIAAGVAFGLVRFALRHEVDDRAPAAASGAVTLTAPERIGGLTRSADQSSADGLRDDLRSSGITTPFAAAYADPADPGHTMLIWGGTGADVGRDAEREIDAFFTSAARALNGGTLGQRSEVDAGQVGGTMRCATVSGLPVPIAACAWASPGAMLGAMVTGVDGARGAAQVQAVLPSIVTGG